MKPIEIYTTKLKIRWLYQDMREKYNRTPKWKIKKWIAELKEKLKSA